MIANRMKNLPGHVQPFICTTQTLTVVLSHLEIRKGRDAAVLTSFTHMEHPGITVEGIDWLLSHQRQFLSSCVGNFGDAKVV